MTSNGSSAATCHNFKVVLLGEGCVGKTSLVLRYVEDRFNDEHIYTSQAAFLCKKLNLNGQRINLSVWDTAGQERFHALGPIYYRDSNGAILVYDITDEDSFQKVKNWVKELRKMLGSDICLVIAGNKIDLEKNRTVPVEEAETYAAKVGATHFSTSAKLNDGVEEMFFNLVQRLLDKSNELNVPAKSVLRQGSQRGTVIVADGDEMDVTPTSKTCCSNG